MENKQKALKTSSKVISVIMKIGYIAMIVAMCICASTLIFLMITKGKTFITMTNGSTLRVAKASATTAEVIALNCQYFVISIFLFVIFMLAQKMFGQISLSGDPFEESYAKTVRLIGILIVAMTFAIGIADLIISLATKVSGLTSYTEAPGIVFGAVIFCLSYIIDYGCTLKNNQQSNN